MAYQATVIKVMIASPGDVADERRTIKDVLDEWNSIHSEDKEIVLLPIGWETHSQPQMGDRPQEIINKQVLENCDLLIAVFWTRIGTPTGKSESGTVEEIEGHLAAGKPAMLYFSSKPVKLDDVDEEQYKQLKEFKKLCKKRGLVEEYDSNVEFREKVSRQIAQKINYDEYFSIYRKQPNNDYHSQISEVGIPALSEEAITLLTEASLDPRGVIMKLRSHDGLKIQANNKQFVESKDRRTEAKWESAIDSLVKNQLIQDRGFKGEIFALTEIGYEVADKYLQDAG